MFFASLFPLDNSKEAWVEVIWDSSLEGGSGVWNPCFSRPFNDWEMDVVESFLVRLHEKRVCGDVEDKVLWTKTKVGKFSIKSLYNTLESGNSVSLPLRSIWNSWVQPKVSFFFCFGGNVGKALTLDLVQKREWALANRCYKCHENEETIDHLLIHCIKTRVLWELPFTMFEVS